MLLMLWPRMRSQGGCEGVGGASASSAAAAAESKQSELPKYSLEEHFWDWLLVLAALLQQAPAETKQQLMKEYGTLLLQLLYYMLLEHQTMGKRGVETAQVLLTVGNLGEVLKKVDAGCVSWGADPMSVVQLVLMVLQSLVYVVDPGRLYQTEKLQEDGLGIIVRGGKLVIL
jgi:hypothetical protein